jgi:DNA-binding ferritin-like protein
MMNNADDESAPTVIRRPTRRAELDAKARIAKESKREFDQKRSTLEFEPAALPLQQSTVPLAAAPFTSAGNIAADSTTKKMKNDLKEVEENMKEVEENMKEVKENMKEVKENMEEVESRIDEAKEALFDAHAEYVRKTTHPAAKPLLHQMAKNATAKIGPDDTAASEMQQLTNTSLEKSDVIKASRGLQRFPSETDGKFGFYKRGTKTTTNQYGKTVSLNGHLVNTAKWKYLKEKNMGLPKIIAGKSHNLLETIVQNAALLPHFLECGEDYFQVAEEPISWNKA